MILELTGHEYRYAAEQIMLMMFPGERPEYGAASKDALSASISLNRGKKYAVSVTRLYHEGAEYRGQARCVLPDPHDCLAIDREYQKIIKLSFYKAAVSATDQHPVWGALTGIRPAKLASRMLAAGKTDAYAEAHLRLEFFVSPERAILCTAAAHASLNVQRTLEKNDVCLYVGIPFCPTRCAYCSFVSHSVEKSMKLIPPFLDALYAEISASAAVVRELGLRIISVYMGGGTPTTLSASQLGDLIDRLYSEYDLSHCREFTVEAGRPDTITAEKLAVMKENGVTRISVNPQSMRDEVLTAIGRRHTAQDVLDSLALARQANIPEINMDLIAGLPADTPEGFYATLNTVLSLRPENITVHTLALKKGSRVTLEKTPLPGPADVAKMLDRAAARLSGAGYVPYYLYRQKFMSGGFENVGWALPGTENIYNICIMEELCSILSLGGGGSEKLVAPETGRIERVFNPKYPQEYIAGKDKVCSSKEYAAEFYRKYIFSPKE